MTSEELTSLARPLRTLEEVTRWAFAHRFDLRDIVTQDEYTHDVIVAAAPHFLVFDTT